MFCNPINLAHETGGQVITLEHIFWGMSQEPSKVRDVMSQFGITPRKVRDLVSEFRVGNQPSANVVAMEERWVSTLKKCAKNVIKMEEASEIDLVIGCEDEIRRVLLILSRKTKNIPVLVG